MSRRIWKISTPAWRKADPEKRIDWCMDAMDLLLSDAELEFRDRAAIAIILTRFAQEIDSQIPRRKFNERASVGAQIVDALVMHHKARVEDALAAVEPNDEKLRRRTRYAYFRMKREGPTLAERLLAPIDFPLDEYVRRLPHRITKKFK